MRTAMVAIKALPEAESEIASALNQKLARSEIVHSDSGPDPALIANGSPFRPGVR
ncbi:IS5 family transposase [Arthrobacter sp. UYNi723]